MATLTDTVRSLYNILRQERARGYDDKAVIGGLDGFLERFAADLEPLLGGLTSYASLTTEERSEWSRQTVERMRASVGVSSKPATSDPRPPSDYRTPARRQSRKPAAPARPLKMDDDVTRMKGVWRKMKPRLDNIGVSTVGDLVYLFPNRHADYTKIRKVAQLSPGDDQTAILTVWEAGQTMLGRQKSTQAVLGDETGTVRAVWFNNPWLASRLKQGSRVWLSGKVAVFRGNMVFQGAECEILDADDDTVHTGRGARGLAAQVAGAQSPPLIIPVYPSTQGLSQRVLRTLVRRALDDCLRQIDEFLPEDVLHRTGLIGLRDAVEQMHYPDDWDSHQQARRRLAFDELFMLQLSVLVRRLQWREAGGALPLRVAPEAIDAFLGTLSFDLTGAQTRAITDILSDVESDHAMSRLLQGDVGSGKTIVATAAMLAAVHNGSQAALMAPTEILAEQHFLTICRLLDGPGFESAGGSIQTLSVAGLDRKLTAALLLGGQRKRVRDDLTSLLSAGMVDVVVGTHALIQESVDIPNLSLAVVDEQHRFGVAQRAKLREKGVRPHFLAMSATPIPRSLAMTLYGDLDVSVIDEMPPGRQPIRTRFVENDRRASAYEFVRNELEAGRQAFVVCPLIDESEVVQTKAAQEEFERLSTTVFADRAVGLLHGRMSLVEKEGVMARFKAGQLDVLVATPVIEVGIDVPNATVMLIDGAERFGLSQLHQLRGRVGRGPHKSHCLLLSESPGSEALNRLKLLERTSDGFRLAEEDLKLRGPGDYLGTRQSGLPTFRVAQITDQDIVSLARREADRLLATDPDLSRPEHGALASAFTDYSSRLAGEHS